jgi:hypothetical protein
MSLRHKVRVTLDTERVTRFYEYFDGEALSGALSDLLLLLLEEYEKNPAALEDVLDKMYEKLQDA